MFPESKILRYVYIKYPAFMPCWLGEKFAEGHLRGFQLDNRIKVIYGNFEPTEENFRGMKAKETKRNPIQTNFHTLLIH